MRLLLTLALLFPSLLAHRATLKWPQPSTSMSSHHPTHPPTLFHDPVHMSPSRHPPHDMTYVITDTSITIRMQSQMYTFPSHVMISTFINEMPHVMKHTCHMDIDDDMTLSSYLTNHPHTSMTCPHHISIHPFQSHHYHHNIPTRNTTQPKMTPFQQQQEFPINSIDLLADTISGDYTWVKEYAMNHFGPMHPFPSYTNHDTDTGVYDMNTGHELTIQQYQQQSQQNASNVSIRIALVADWGAGTYESDLVSHLMLSRSTINDSFDPHYTVHIGDIYYVGTPDEVAANTMGIPPKGVEKGVKWPHGSIGSFALNGNHEMYSRGFGYFDHFLPTLGIRNASAMSGQKASYFALSNENWRIIALDTGYNSYSKWHIDEPNNPQPEEVMTWLNDVLQLSDPSDIRGIIFMSHHQALSAFDEVYLATPKQLESILPVNRTFLWLWGHEHRLAFYDIATLLVDPNDPTHVMSLYSRCIGNGGYPTSTGPPPSNARDSTLNLLDDRVYEVESGWTKISVGYNGWAHLTFTGSQLDIEYYSLTFDTPNDSQLSGTKSQLLVTETFNVQWGDIQLTNQVVVDNDITRVTHF